MGDKAGKQKRGRVGEAGWQCEMRYGREYREVYLKVKSRSRDNYQGAAPVVAPNATPAASIDPAEGAGDMPLSR